jgi:transmembrane sensor
VLGTEFDVRASPRDAETDVLVRSGRVALSSTDTRKGAARILTTGERGTIDQSGSVRVQNGIDTDSALAWTQGTLVFRAAPLRDVIPELERWYDLRIRLSDPELSSRRITASFTNESVDLVLQTLGELIPARWSRTGREVTFSPM